MWKRNHHILQIRNCRGQMLNEQPIDKEGIEQLMKQLDEMLKEEEEKKNGEN